MFSFLFSVQVWILAPPFINSVTESTLFLTPCNRRITLWKWGKQYQQIPRLCILMSEVKGLGQCLTHVNKYSMMFTTSVLLTTQGGGCELCLMGWRARPGRLRMIKVTHRVPDGARVHHQASWFHWSLYFTSKLSSHWSPQEPCGLEAMISFLSLTLMLLLLPLRQLPGIIDKLPAPALDIMPKPHRLPWGYVWLSLLYNNRRRL